MLEDSGHFPEFAEFIRENMYEDQDADIVAQLKSVLWAVVR
jgi:large subunit ribosomal protein L17e